MSLRLGLIGFGRMGKAVSKHASGKGFQVVATYSSTSKLSRENLPESVDVFVDFSRPTEVLGNVKSIMDSGKALVIGTTGWDHQLEEVKNLVQSTDIGVIYASNFSVGMNLFFKIIEYASALFDKFNEFDPYIHEVHHRGKLDSPSGTALSLGQIVLAKIKRKNDLLAQKSEGRISPDQLHITSTRAGHYPGSHLVGFDSTADSIELKHMARSRDGFALGALDAAQWIVGKRGFFTMDDFLRDRLK